MNIKQFVCFDNYISKMVKKTTNKNFNIENETESD